MYSMSAQGVVFATAMAVSGTVILLALRLQKSFPVHEIPPSPSPSPILRSCLFSDERKREKKKKKKKVQFAKDVVDSCKDGEEFRRQHNCLKSKSESKVQKNCSNNGGTDKREMPANRAALYNGILRDRGSQRLAYSF
ncbi:hypothetical protein TanjilG_07015 [Lupinus angustifolius]|uniref:Uncharacterized protein n=1 Tax=Lupinus angustifolius TaxID=3871 RepID=A0A1J7IYC0_LUPAN|nr:PREDICTED: uncharacterized protein LOC109345521 [Lupinus angustifolius]XP_019440131.1 PREDICTED: uncharacterized protein LOC109345521 [Lupinus angustifolius]OIW19560.1 hypothetical protein TanjilG_07015 [Lupinus angustifolius]